MYEHEFICIAVLAVALYTLYNCVYNLYFHPLSRFPGPRLAALGHLYDLWYDCIKDGRYAWKVKEMHLKYGPIVRVNCRELHILDPDFYSSIYSGAGKGRVDKDPVATAGFTVPNATLGTLEHSHHRARREVLSPYFSKRAVVGLEPVINSLIDRLVSRFAEYADAGEAVDLDAAFGALTGDIISAYVFGFSWNFLDVEKFKFPQRDGILGLINWYHWSTFVPQAAKILRQFPLFILQIIHPGIASMETARLEVRQQLAAAAKGRPRQDNNPEPNAGLETMDGKAAIVSALHNGTLPPEERTIDRMTDEGMTLIFAGTETTGRTLAVTMFHVLNNREYLERLRKELADAVPECLGQDYQFSMTQIDQLPFLVSL